MENLRVFFPTCLRNTQGYCFFKFFPNVFTLLEKTNKGRNYVSWVILYIPVILA